MTADETSELSPEEQYIEYCRRGVLAYQVCSDDGKAIFFPRLLNPGSGSPNLEWRVSGGRGCVYTTTVVYRRGEAPYNVAMIDVDEGFRLMSRVEDIDPEEVHVGLRVTLRMHPATDKTPPYPVFAPAEGQ